MNAYKVKGHILQDGSNLGFERIVEADSKADAIAMAKAMVKEKYPWIREDRIIRGPVKVEEIEL